MCFDCSASSASRPSSSTCLFEQTQQRADEICLSAENRIAIMFALCLPRHLRLLCQPPRLLHLVNRNEGIV